MPSGIVIIMPLGIHVSAYCTVSFWQLLSTAATTPLLPPSRS